jgi:type VI secretion system protein ImpG
MSDELLPYYDRELAFIRRLGAEFAEAHPKIAGRLRLSADTAEDPHVERLIEAFAYLNARIRHKLDDDFPELSDAMLGVLYPHYVAPLPAMSIVQFVLERSQGELKDGYDIPRETELESEPIDGTPCRFHTCYPVTLWPVELVEATLAARPFAAPETPFSAQAVAVLHLKLQGLSKDLPLAALSMDRLRFYLKGQAQHVYALYEVLFNNVLGVALAASPKDRQPTILGRECIEPVGFERDQAMLPYSARSFAGYRLLTEYFVFPQKFLFFDLARLGNQALARIGRTLDVYCYLSRSTQELEQNITADSLQLGCTPMVNLYPQRAEPIKLTQTQTEYRVVPDARRPRSCEVYSIDRVVATSPTDEQMEFSPFYSVRHAEGLKQQKRFWHPVRRPASGVDPGTEVYLSLVDLTFDPAQVADWTLDVQTMCLDRDLPHRLPFGEGEPRLRLTVGAPLERITCLTRPTRTLRPALRRGALWRLISHLSLNHLSLVDYEEGADALWEILKLYDFADSAQTRAMIDGILCVRSQRIAGRAGDPRAGFCRGLEVTVHFDETRFAGSGVYLFACVLERFLALYCSVNSFSRLIATTNKREGELRRWAPRAGETVLL